MVIFIKNKSKIFSHFQEICSFIENQFDSNIKVFRNDNGIKFVNQNFSVFYEEFFLHKT
jgi:hypothetical protein